MSIWLKIMQSTVCISTAYRLSSIPPATKTYAGLCDVVAKAHSDRKARHFSFSTSSHPTKGRSIDVLVTASTRVMLDAPLGW